MCIVTIVLSIEAIMIVPMQAMAIKAYPNNIPYSLERLALMLDEIWYQAGDQSTDINWYTKRGMLAGVYCSTGWIKKLFLIPPGVHYIM